MGIIESQTTLLAGAILANPLLAILLAVSLVGIIQSLYRISRFHHLSRVPGPLYAKTSSLYLLYHAYIGDEASAVHALHQKYGAIVRTGPNSVDIADGEALQGIYVEKGGFLKPSFYGNFDIDGHKSIFSAIDPLHRSPRAKAVISIFSTANLRHGADVIESAIDGFIGLVRRQVAYVKDKHAPERKSIDILGLCRALAIDVVSIYLFGMKYGACEEDLKVKEIADAKVSGNASPRQEMTANAMVDSFVAVGRMWYLPPQMFQLVERVQNMIFPNEAATTSIDVVDKFVAEIVSKTINEKTHSSYPGRLLQAGFDESEVRAQCKDLIFAGTDSTAMNLATICFHLVQNPQAYQNLRDAVLNTDLAPAEIQSVPYLRGVVREGLRLALANPSRLPRIVPPEGWTFKGSYIPGGTEVSCTPFSLHFDPETYPDPHTFRPERWLPENSPTEAMNRDLIPFALGSRQCIARNLATTELFCAVKRIAEEDLLAGLSCVQDKIEIHEWFNSHVVGGKIEMAIKKD